MEVEFIELQKAVDGPVPLGQEICHIASEFEGSNVIPLLYESVEQSPRLIEDYKLPVDKYMFAGPSPFSNSIEIHSKSKFVL